MEHKVKYFKKQGYKQIGKFKKGKSLRTAIMVKERLITMAGRLRKIFNIDKSI